MSDDIFKSFQPLPSAPAAGTPVPVGIGEVWDASRKLQAQDESDAAEKRMMRNYAPYIDAINDVRRAEGLPEMPNPVLGRRLRAPRAAPSPDGFGNAYSYARAAGENAPGSYDQVGRDAAMADVAAEVERIRRKRPDFLKGQTADPAKIAAAGIDRDKAERAKAQDVMSRSEGYLQGAVGIAGTITKSVEDPAVLLSLPFGGGARTVIGTIAKEFVINGITTAMMQPQVAENRIALGEDLTLGEAAGNTLSAAVGGSIIGGGIKLAAPIAAKVYGGGAERLYDMLPAPLQERWARGGDIPDGALPDIAETVIGRANIDPDTRAAINVVRRYGEMADSSPYRRTPQGDEAFAARLDREVVRLQQPDPPRRADLRGGTALSSGAVPPPRLGRVAEPAMEGYLRTIRRAESGGSDAAKAATSSAYGRYQFLRGTWMRYYVARFGRQGLTDAEILAKRADGQLQDVLVADLTRDNAATLRNRGQAVTADHLYLLHFAGAGDGMRVLEAAGDTPVRALMSAASIRANPFLRDMTAADLRAWAARKTGGAPVEPGRAAPSVDVDATARIDAERAALDAEGLRLAREGGAVPRETIGDVPRAADAPTEFTTAKGSTYRVEADGTTTRDKAFRPEHGPDDRGPQPTSQATYYVSPGDAAKLGEFQAEGQGAVAIQPLPDGRVGLRYLDGADAGRFELRTVVQPEARAAEGLVPVEVWDDGRRVHFGNEIVSVSSPRGEASARGAERMDYDPVPHDDYDAVAPYLGGDGPEPSAPPVLDHDDPIWAAIDRHEAEQSVRALADPAPVPDALKAYDEPGSAAHEAAIDSGMHDLRRIAELTPDARIRLDVDGEERTVAALVQDLDEEDAVITAVKACL